MDSLRDTAPESSRGDVFLFYFPAGSCIAQLEETVARLTTKLRLQNINTRVPYLRLAAGPIASLHIGGEAQPKQAWQQPACVARDFTQRRQQVSAEKLSHHKIGKCMTMNLPPLGCTRFDHLEY